MHEVIKYYGALLAVTEVYLYGGACEKDGMDHGLDDFIKLAHGVGDHGAFYEIDRATILSLYTSYSTVYSVKHKMNTDDIMKPYKDIATKQMFLEWLTGRLIKVIPKLVKY